MWAMHTGSLSCRASAMLGTYACHVEPVQCWVHVPANCAASEADHVQQFKLQYYLSNTLQGLELMDELQIMQHLPISLKEGAPNNATCHQRVMARAWSRCVEPPWRSQALIQEGYTTKRACHHLMVVVVDSNVDVLRLDK